MSDLFWDWLRGHVRPRAKTDNEQVFEPGAARAAMRDWTEYQRRLGPLTDPTEYDCLTPDVELLDEEADVGINS
jgi:hypothetical protein